MIDLKHARRIRRPDAAQSGKLPPHSIETEQAVIGCIIFDAGTCLPQCLERIESESFYDLRHRIIYAAAAAMFNNSQPIDMVTLQAKLANDGTREQVGGFAYLTLLVDAVISTAMLPAYLDELSDKFQQRRLVEIAGDILAMVHQGGQETETMLDEAERGVLSLRAGKTTGHKPINELVRSAIDRMEETIQRHGAMGGIGTGLDSLDKMTDGLHGGEMIVIAARPSLGKTSLAMGIAEHVAMTLGLPVGVFSLEMQSDALLMRSLCANARVNLSDVRSGFLSPSDYPKFTSAAGRIGKSPLHIDDTGGLSIMQLRARARRMWQQFGIRLFVVDYLQLLHSTNPRCADNRQQEIADISSGIKSLAKELNVPIVALSQLNRDIEKDKARRPRLSDLRESGAIEQDADLVGLLYKPGQTEAETQDESDCVPLNLLIAKQRNGPCGDVPLNFIRPQTRFEIRQEKPEPASEKESRYSHD